MSELRRPQLTSPFKNVKQISKGGQSFDYIPTANVVDRLNTVLGVGGWSFEVEARRDGDWIVAKGRLSACGGVYEQYGGQQIKFLSSGEKGRPVDLGDEFKGAASDALKKCCQSIGLGLYLALGHPPLSASLGEVAGGQDAGNESKEGSDTAPGSNDLRPAGDDEHPHTISKDQGTLS